MNPGCIQQEIRCLKIENEPIQSRERNSNRQALGKQNRDGVSTPQEQAAKMQATRQYYMRQAFPSVGSDTEYPARYMRTWKLQRPIQAHLPHSTFGIDTENPILSFLFYHFPSIGFIQWYHSDYSLYVQQALVFPLASRKRGSVLIADSRSIPTATVQFYLPLSPDSKKDIDTRRRDPWKEERCLSKSFLPRFAPWGDQIHALTCQ